jgi:hypothetical protein
MICPQMFPIFFSKREPLYRASITPSHIRSQGIKGDLSSLALSNTYNTHQSLCDDCPRSWPGEHFNLPRCVNQDISVSRKTIKEVLHLYMLKISHYTKHQTTGYPRLECPLHTAKSIFLPSSLRCIPHSPGFVQCPIFMLMGKSSSL